MRQQCYIHSKILNEVFLVSKNDFKGFINFLIFHLLNFRSHFDEDSEIRFFKFKLVDSKSRISRFLIGNLSYFKHLNVYLSALFEQIKNLIL